MDEYKTNAPKGAALLDGAEGVWADRIDPKTFLISSIGRCVLGQLYGDYDSGTVELFGDLAYGDLVELAREFGFFGTAGNWDALQDEWVALIKERQSA
jgi:hypothetical protein